MAFETLRDEAPSVNNMLDRFEERMNRGQIEETETTAVFETVEVGLKTAKAKLNDQTTWDSLSDDEIARLSNPWTAWEVNKVFNNADDPALKNLQTLLTPGVNDKQERTRRYSRQVWRTEMVSFLIAKMEVNDDKAAMSTRLEKIMAAQIVKENESSASSALRISMHLDPQITDKSVREGLANEMEASTITEKSLESIQNEHLKTLGLEIMEVKVVVGGDLLIVPKDQTESLTFKNVLIKQDKNRVYAQLENGCRGNLVILELGPLDKIENEDGKQTEDGAQTEEGRQLEDDERGPNYLGEQIPALMTLLQDKSEYSVNPIRVEGKPVQTIQIGRAGAQDGLLPITIEYDEVKKTFRGKIIDTSDNERTYESPSIEEVTRKTINEDFTEKAVDKIVEAYKDTWTGLIEDLHEKAPFLLDGDQITFARTGPLNDPITLKGGWVVEMGMTAPFPEEMNLTQLADRLNQKYREVKRIDSPEDNASVRSDLISQVPMLSGVLKAKTTYYVVTLHQGDGSVVLILKDKEGKRSKIQITFNLESDNYESQVDGRIVSNPDLLELTKSAVNAEYLKDYPATAVKSFLKATTLPIDSEFSEAPFYYNPNGFGGKILGHYTGPDTIQGIHQPEPPYPSTVEWSKLVEQLNTEYLKQSTPTPEEWTKWVKDTVEKNRNKITEIGRGNTPFTERADGYIVFAELGGLASDPEIIDARKWTPQHRNELLIKLNTEWNKVVNEGETSAP